MIMNVYSTVHVGLMNVLPMASIFLHATDSCNRLMQLTHVCPPDFASHGLHEPVHLDGENACEDVLQGCLPHDVVHGGMRNVGGCPNDNCTCNCQRTYQHSTHISAYATVNEHVHEHTHAGAMPHN